MSKKDFDFMRQDGDIGAMDYDQAVKNGEIFFGWLMWMEEDGYAPGESIAFYFENGDRKSTRLNSSHLKLSRMPSSA